MGDRYGVSENNNTVLLNLHSVTRNDAGHYTLTAKNSAGEARRAIEIKVDGAGSDVPVFLRRLSDLAVKVGTRTRFLVEIRCSSEVTVSGGVNDAMRVFTRHQLVMSARAWLSVPPPPASRHRKMLISGGGGRGVSHFRTAHEFMKDLHLQ